MTQHEMHDFLVPRPAGRNAAESNIDQDQRRRPLGAVHGYPWFYKMTPAPRAAPTTQKFVADAAKYYSTSYSMSAGWQ